LQIAVVKAIVDRDQLNITWNGVNEENLPAAVQWGPPRLKLSGPAELQLLYTYQPAAGAAGDAPANLPPQRQLGPGEVMSRTLVVHQSAIGKPLLGLQVIVALGYGPADTLPAAPVKHADYVAWQRVALSRPRMAEAAPAE
jgi:hypothetical protein